MITEGIPSVSIHSEMAAKLNFACHQSAFAFLRDLRIENDDFELQLNDALVTLSSDPAFLKPKSWRMDRLAPEGIISIKDRDIELDGGFLLNLADSIRGTVTITVESDGQVIGEETKAVELLEAGMLQVDPLVTHRFPLSRAIEAFDVARNKDRHGAIKIILDCQS